MKLRNTLHSILIAAVIAVLAFSGVSPASAQSDGLLHGWFSIVWGDGPSGSYAPAPAYLLTDDSGQATPLLIDDALAASVGGVLSLDRQRVTVHGVQRLAVTGQPGLQVDSITLEPSTQPGAMAQGNKSLVSGSQPFISIMCKFNDVAAEPKDQNYFQDMYGSDYPGLDHYWREASYNTVNIVGSSAVGWYTLPHNRAYYFNADNSFNLDLAAKECTGVANPSVNFAPYKGINMMFNADLDGFAWGGGQYLTLDGVSKVWPITWEPPWGYEAIAVIGHEMGHAFGLPHSSGTFGATYDNQWDVMSDTWSNCSRSTDPTYGCLGQGTISYHKDILGWIPSAQKFIAGSGVNATITLEQLDLPQTANYLMAQIPIAGSATHFYTVEARRQVGYDVKLPGQAVIIHDVDTTRPIPAHVIDGGAGTSADPAEEEWTPGQTFNGSNGISVQVLSATATGFQVAIHTPGSPKVSTIFRSVAADDGWIRETAEKSSLGGTINRLASTFNLGDDAANRQFRGILHFDTSTLPPTAVITKVTLKIMKKGLAGANPFTSLGALRVDIGSPYFGSSPALEAADFQATAGSTAAASFAAKPVGSWYSAALGAAAWPYINRTGPTQFRLRFNLDDNNNRRADDILFYSGNASAAYRPQLVIQYYVP